MKVTAILKGRIDSNGHQPIQIRICDGPKRSYKPTRYKVDPKLWDKGKRKVKPEHPKASEINKQLSVLIIQYQAAYIEGSEKKRPKVEFYAYINQCLDQWEQIRKPGTYRQLISQRDKLKAFAPTLLLSDVTSGFLYQYQNYILAKGNTQNTAWTAFKFIRTIILKALKEKLIEENPFDAFDMPQYTDPLINYLTKEEVQKIEDEITKPECSEELRVAGTWFLIGCKTGLRLSDLKAFNHKKNIVSGRLVVHTQKTQEVVSLPISDKLRRLFEALEYKPFPMTGEHYNRLLKSLALACGIKKRISSHIARHTAAVLMADAGVSQETVQAILGHKSIKTTAIYFKVTNRRIDDELKSKMPD
jgi:site-specific recombinase XerD